MAKQTKNASSGGESFMVKLSTFIVDKRNLFFLITIILVIFSMFSRNWVEVENDLTFYLPEDSETKKALNVMDGEFTTYGTAEVMVANIAYEDAERMLDDLKEIKGVQSIDFDDTTDHYNNASALYSITFNYDETDDACLESLDKVKEYLSGQDIYVKTDLGNTQAETIEREINMIMVYVAIVIVAVLLFTSETYGEIPVLILTFGVGMIVNQGTNYLLGKISFVSNSVTSILQLALSIDYAIIFCNRFKEEHKSLPIREAVILALSKSIPEIGASSLTTIGGLVAMLFMQFRLGPDMAICLIKSIGFALLSAFVVMPGLLVLFGPLIDRTGHKNFVPKISFIGSYDYATRHIVPIIFIVVLFFAFRLSSDCPYAYGYSVLSTPKLNETQIAENMIEDNFSSSNMMALVVPKGDYEKEAQLLKELESYDEVDYTMGLANIDALDGYKLADKLTPRQFAELADLDYEAAQVVYAAYAAENESYGELVGNIATYKVPLIDMFLYVCDKVDSGVVTLSDEQTDLLHDAEVQMTSAKNQLQGETYSRMLLYLTLPVSGDETYHFTDKILEIARSYYPDEDVFLAGDSTNEYDFEKSFAVDNTVVSIVSVLIVLVVLLFTFNSAGMPLLLILVIQGSIWINFSFPTITGKYLFFLGYLVVSSIQMGANIDYAIVIGSRYQELKAKMTKKAAIIDTLNFAFPTIITSGSILAISGFLIGNLTSEPVIAGIGESLGRGTVISIFLVMLVLPQILLTGTAFIDKTSFSMPGVSVGEHRALSGKVFVNGMVRGHISGNVRGQICAMVDGDVDLNVISGSADEEGGAPDDTPPDGGAPDDSGAAEAAPADGGREEESHV
ncbi:MAG: MMPL family transporter [Firmicutes bacterium]|nr:MMPL family transporter [Bacillota bacterium]